MPNDAPQTTPLEVLARAIDASGFDQSPAVEVWAAQRRQSAYDKARKYLAALDAAGFAVVPAKPTAEMIEAGARAMACSDNPDGGHRWDANSSYRTMVRAANGQ